MRLIEATIDVAEDVPTLAELIKYRVESMRVRVRGPAGGNPCLTLKFVSRDDAVRFLVEWYQADPTGDESPPPEIFLNE